MKVQGDIRDALTPKDEADEHAAIVEIRAGKYVILKNCMYTCVQYDEDGYIVPSIVM